eukprot:scaffold201383_cov16-Prasinocladus_malaysianus.AAC.2
MRVIVAVCTYISGLVELAIMPASSRLLSVIGLPPISASSRHLTFTFADAGVDLSVSASLAGSYDSSCSCALSIFIPWGWQFPILFVIALTVPVL